MSIEIIENPTGKYRIKNALFDFDGTLSLIREGWQQVMIPYFLEEMAKCPNCPDAKTTEDIVTEFVDRLTGKQTIYQCMALVDEIKKYGGNPETPKYYKDEYVRRLMERIRDRREGLANGTLKPEDYLVRGSVEFLTLLKSHGVTMFLASGSDEPQVKEEVALLGLTEFFGNNIYGAKDATVDCSKDLVIKELLATDGVAGNQLIAFGDGFVEIELVVGAGGYGVAVATDEKHPGVLDNHKREKLLRAGAGMCIPDFSDAKGVIEALNGAFAK